MSKYNIEGIGSWEELLQMAEDVNPPDYQPDDSDNWSGDTEYKLPTGWTVIIFYDCGELDYIDSFVTPSGTIIDFWEWEEEHPWRQYLINWRGVGDLESLKEIDEKEKNG